jgi:hypothetical protein
LESPTQNLGASTLLLLRQESHSGCLLDRCCRRFPTRLGSPLQQTGWVVCTPTGCCSKGSSSQVSGQSYTNESRGHALRPRRSINPSLRRRVSYLGEGPELNQCRGIAL